MARSASGLRGASAEAYDMLTGRLSSVLSDGGSANGYDVARDLFGVAEVLRREPGLRRVLTDVSVGSQAKSGLVRRVFGESLGEGGLDVAATAAGQRWAAVRDLADTLEHLAVIAVVRAAEADGEADAVEEQLFTVERLVADNPSLRDALGDPARSVEDKQGLLRGLLEGKAARGTIQLVEQAVTGTHRTVGLAIEAYQRLAASERERVVALVRVARPLSDTESDRLKAALTRQYSRAVDLNVLVDPAVLGGVRVEVGDDVIDGTVSTRLDDARRKLAG
ncbi:F0F1 ATP synthase subunit delta [Nocardioides marmoribigeumensis]|uniref:ATP synthase subunit delta n=1 Tax=Nocardioides marmoribigeumensis TaxID=433649 RepID=A0ABU2BZ13_9ACTN|nr:F0F1 ATP synthase subunit delta [Nocardioides marmoribigeumensis]MDR7363612.1 F-type H+-transporting ATPase subunit delta [Nocardioides marmoribigeumensis]